jgi:hypothetical protein
MKIENAVLEHGSLENPTPVGCNILGPPFDGRLPRTRQRRGPEVVALRKRRAVPTLHTSASAFRRFCYSALRTPRSALGCGVKPGIVRVIQSSYRNHRLPHVQYAIRTTSISGKTVRNCSFATPTRLYPKMSEIVRACSKLLRNVP